MFFTIAFLFFAVAQWEKAALYKEATIMAEQVANTWDLSSKNLDSGEFPLLIKSEDTGRDADGRAKDGLYWRFSDMEGSKVADEKLDTARKTLQEKGITGSVNYTGLPMRTVTVTLTRNLDFMKKLKLPFFSDKVTATASAHVSEPVQFMRNIDMAIYYEKVMAEVLTGDNSIFKKFEKPKK